MIEIIVFTLCACAMALVGAMNRKAHVEKAVVLSRSRQRRSRNSTP